MRESILSKKPLKQQGFTLIELMIALAVTALAIVGYIGANLIVQQNSEALFEKTLALQDASRVIEQMRNAAQTGQFPNNVTGVFPNGAQVTGFNNLTNEQVIVTYASSTANPLDATVTVTWLSNGRRATTTALRTFITQR